MRNSLINQAALSEININLFSVVARCVVSRKWERNSKIRHSTDYRTCINKSLLNNYFWEERKELNNYFSRERILKQFVLLCWWQTHTKVSQTFKNVICFCASGAKTTQRNPQRSGRRANKGEKECWNNQARELSVVRVCGGGRSPQQERKRFLFAEGAKMKIILVQKSEFRIIMASKKERFVYALYPKFPGHEWNFQGLLFSYEQTCTPQNDPLNTTPSPIYILRTGRCVDRNESKSPRRV